MSRFLISPTHPYVGNCYPPEQAQPGTVWYDSGEQHLKVYDGYRWVRLEMPQPMLSWEAEMALEHVIQRMNEQGKIAEMAAKYPLVAEALGQLEGALKLCQNLDANET